MQSLFTKHRVESGSRAALAAVALFFALSSPMLVRTAAAPAEHKLSLPDPGAQEKALAALQENFKDDYEKDRAALAGKFLQKAKETLDPTQRFVMLREAKNLAVETFQSEVAFEAIDELAGTYDVSMTTIKAEVVEQSAKNAHTTKEKRTIAKAALQVAEAAMAEEDFDLARRMVQQAEEFARLKEIAAKKKEVETAAKTYAAVQEAMKTLEDKPGDPEANLILGKYLCLTKGDWAKGLPMLAKSDDAKWQPLAKKDMDGADTAKDMARLGDAWWGASKGRAVYWYKQALPGTSGAEKDRIKKRIALAGSSSSPSARLIPTITDSRTETWSGSTTNAARYSRLTFAVANGKGDVGYGGAGMEIQDVPELTVAVEASPAFRYYDVNSFAGFMVDYHTKSGYTKRLALGIGMHDKGRWESQPSWGGPRETAGSCRSGNPRDL